MNRKKDMIIAKALGTMLKDCHRGVFDCPQESAGEICRTCKFAKDKPPTYSTDDCVALKGAIRLGELTGIEWAFGGTKDGFYFLFVFTDKTQMLITRKSIALAFRDGMTEKCIAPECHINPCYYCRIPCDIPEEQKPRKILRLNRRIEDALEGRINAQRNDDK